MGSMHIIYYGSGGGLIKIGCTKDREHLQARTFAHRMRYSDYVLLAARDGGTVEEHRTQRMFAHLLVEGAREWFHPGSDLLMHLCMVARGDYNPEVLPFKQPAVVGRSLPMPTVVDF